jgi:hypothetical protein
LRVDRKDLPITMITPEVFVARFTCHLVRI